MVKTRSRSMRWRRCLPCGVLALSIAGLVQAGQEPSADDVQAALTAANALFKEGKADEARARLEESVEAGVDDSRVWLLLGRASRQSGALEEARHAFQRALEDSQRARGAAQGLFRVYLAEGDRSSALDAYRRLRQLPGIDFSGLHLLPEVAELRGDRRFSTLFPSAESFDDPFVEGRALIHDWQGEAGYEHGWEARNAGDVDQDGISDIVSSAPANQPGADASGFVYLYSGKTGELLWQVAGEPGDRLGTGIEAAGDVDADGVPDVIAGAVGAGRVYVYSGRSGGVIRTFEADDEDGNAFGTAVAGVGDVNADGHSDLLVGSPSSGEGAGRAVLYSGKDGQVLWQVEGEAGEGLGSTVAGAWSETPLLVVGAPNNGQGGRVLVFKGLDPTPAFVIEPADSGAQLGGMFSSVVGDVDGDGTPDVYASDWLDGGKGPATGRVYVHSGKDGHRLLEIAGETAGEGFGIGPARAGDVDGDGHDDLVVGAWQHGSAAHSGGRIYVLSGKDGSLIKTYTGKVAGETLGFDADGLGDVDGDGELDFLVTSAWSLKNGVRSGRTLVLSGALD